MGGERKRDRLKRALFGPSDTAIKASVLEQIPSIASSSTSWQRASANIETKLPDQVAESSLNGPKVQNEVRDLWADALQKLSDEDKTVLQSSSASKLDGLEDLCAAAKRKRDECDNRRWKFELNGRQIILRDVAEKIIIWINKFQEIGDIAVNFDPVHAALPWAGVRFLLQVRVEYLVY
jgi:ankyrin repeat domain-containing protein 50